MKIITMKRLTENGEPLADDDYTACDPNDWFCVIETPEEELVYDLMYKESKGLAGETTIEHIWNEMVKHAGLDEGLAWGDDDVYYYFRPDETVPEIGGTFKLDGDTWYRVV